MSNEVRIPGGWDVKPEPIVRAQFAGEGYDWGGMMLYLDRVHKMGITGKDTSVVVIDSGFYPGHMDLDDDVYTANFTDEDMFDGCGHSTHVRGIINMQPNGKGLIGVSPSSKVHVAKSLRSDGFGTMKAYNDCFEWAIMEIWPDIINLSLRLPENKRTKTLIREAEKRNILLVAASGNQYEEQVAFPANDDYVISVGAHDKHEKLAEFSNTGKTINELNIVGPGVDVRSAWIDGNLRRCDGTSMATPHVSGVCALIIDWFVQTKGYRPSVMEVKKILWQSCLDLGREGQDAEYGCGRVTTDFTGVEKSITTYKESKVPNGCILGTIAKIFGG